MVPPAKNFRPVASPSRKVTRASQRILRSATSSSSRSEATPSTGTTRPRRSGSSRYNLTEKNDMTGMSWAEEAALKRALLASMHDRSSRGKNAAAVAVLTAGLDDDDDDDDDDESQSGSSFIVVDDEDDDSMSAQQVASKLLKQQIKNSNARLKLAVPQAPAARKYASNSGMFDSDGRAKTSETSRSIGRKARGCHRPVFHRPKSVFDESKGVIYTEDFIDYLCSPMSVGPKSSMAAHVGLRSVDGSLSGSSSNGDNPRNHELSASRSSDRREHMGLEQQPRGAHTSRKSEAPRPVAVATNDADSLGSYIYTTLLPPAATHRGKFIGSHNAALRADAVLYAKEELRLRKSLRLLNIKQKTFKLCELNSNTRSSKDPLFTSAVPHTCSATGRACYLSLVVANGDVLSTEHAALLGSALASDCKSTLYTLISDVALQAFIKDKRD